MRAVLSDLYPEPKRSSESATPSRSSDSGGAAARASTAPGGGTTASGRGSSASITSRASTGSKASAHSARAGSQTWIGSVVRNSVHAVSSLFGGKRSGDGASPPSGSAQGRRGSRRSSKPHTTGGTPPRRKRSDATRQLGTTASQTSPGVSGTTSPASGVSEEQLSKIAEPESENPHPVDEGATKEDHEVMEQSHPQQSEFVGEGTEATGGTVAGGSAGGDESPSQDIHPPVHHSPDIEDDDAAHRAQNHTVKHDNDAELEFEPDTDAEDDIAGEEASSFDANDVETEDTLSPMLSKKVSFDENAPSTRVYTPENSDRTHTSEEGNTSSDESSDASQREPRPVPENDQYQQLIALIKERNEVPEEELSRIAASIDPNSHLAQLVRELQHQQSMPTERNIEEVESHDAESDRQYTVPTEAKGRRNFNETVDEFLDYLQAIAEDHKAHQEAMEIMDGMDDSASEATSEGADSAWSDNESQLTAADHTGRMSETDTGSEPGSIETDVDSGLATSPRTQMSPVNDDERPLPPADESHKISDTTDGADAKQKQAQLESSPLQNENILQQHEETENPVHSMDVKSSQPHQDDEPNAMHHEEVTEHQPDKIKNARHSVVVDEGAEAAKGAVVESGDKDAGPESYVSQPVHHPPAVEDIGETVEPDAEHIPPEEYAVEQTSSSETIKANDDDEVNSETGPTSEQEDTATVSKPQEPETGNDQFKSQHVPEQREAAEEANPNKQDGAASPEISESRSSSASQRELRGMLASSLADINAIEAAPSMSDSVLEARRSSAAMLQAGLLPLPTADQHGRSPGQVGSLETVGKSPGEMSKQPSATPSDSELAHHQPVKSLASIADALLHDDVESETPDVNVSQSTVGTANSMAVISSQLLTDLSPAEFAKILAEQDEDEDEQVIQSIDMMAHTEEDTHQHSMEVGVAQPETEKNDGEETSETATIPAVDEHPTEAGQPATEDDASMLDAYAKEYRKEEDVMAELRQKGTGEDAGIDANENDDGANKTDIEETALLENVGEDENVDEVAPDKTNLPPDPSMRLDVQTSALLEYGEYPYAESNLEDRENVKEEVNTDSESKPSVTDKSEEEALEDSESKPDGNEEGEEDASTGGQMMSGGEEGKEEVSANDASKPGETEEGEGVDTTAGESTLNDDEGKDGVMTSANTLGALEDGKDDAIPDTEDMSGTDKEGKDGSILDGESKESEEEGVEAAKGGESTVDDAEMRKLEATVDGEGEEGIAEYATYNEDMSADAQGGAIEGASMSGIIEGGREDMIESENKPIDIDEDIYYFKTEGKVMPDDKQEATTDVQMKSDEEDSSKSTTDGEIRPEDVEGKDEEGMEGIEGTPGEEQDDREGTSDGEHLPYDVASSVGDEEREEVIHAKNKPSFDEGVENEKIRSDSPIYIVDKETDEDAIEEERKVSAENTENTESTALDADAKEYNQGDDSKSGSREKETPGETEDPDQSEDESRKAELEAEEILRLEQERGGDTSDAKSTISDISDLRSDISEYVTGSERAPQDQELDDPEADEPNYVTSASNFARKAVSSVLSVAGEIVKQSSTNIREISSTVSAKLARGNVPSTDIDEKATEGIKDATETDKTSVSDETVEETIFEAIYGEVSKQAQEMGISHEKMKEMLNDKIKQIIGSAEAELVQHAKSVLDHVEQHSYWKLGEEEGHVQEHPQKKSSSESSKQSDQSTDSADSSENPSNASSKLSLRPKPHDNTGQNDKSANVRNNVKFSFTKPSIDSIGNLEHDSDSDHEDHLHGPPAPSAHDIASTAFAITKGIIASAAHIFEDGELSARKSRVLASITTLNQGSTSDRLSIMSDTEEYPDNLTQVETETFPIDPDEESGDADLGPADETEPPVDDEGVEPPEEPPPLEDEDAESPEEPLPPEDEDTESPGEPLPPEDESAEPIEQWPPTEDEGVEIAQQSPPPEDESAEPTEEPAPLGTGEQTPVDSQLMTEDMEEPPADEESTLQDSMEQLDTDLEAGVTEAAGSDQAMQSDEAPDDTETSELPGEEAPDDAGVSEVPREDTPDDDGETGVPGYTPDSVDAMDESLDADDPNRIKYEQGLVADRAQNSISMDRITSTMLRGEPEEGAVEVGTEVAGEEQPSAEDLDMDAGEAEGKSIEGEGFDDLEDPLASKTEVKPTETSSKVDEVGSNISATQSGAADDNAPTDSLLDEADGKDEAEPLDMKSSAASNKQSDAFVEGTAEQQQEPDETFNVDSSGLDADFIDPLKEESEKKETTTEEAETEAEASKTATSSESGDALAPEEAEGSGAKSATLSDGSAFDWLRRVSTRMDELGITDELKKKYGEEPEKDIILDNPRDSRNQGSAGTLSSAKVAFSDTGMYHDQSFSPDDVYRVRQSSTQTDVAPMVLSSGPTVGAAGGTEAWVSGHQPPASRHGRPGAARPRSPLKKVPCGCCACCVAMKQVVSGEEPSPQAVPYSDDSCDRKFRRRRKWTKVNNGAASPVRCVGDLLDDGSSMTATTTSCEDVEQYAGRLRNPKKWLKAATDEFMRRECIRQVILKNDSVCDGRTKTKVTRISRQTNSLTDCLASCGRVPASQALQMQISRGEAIVNGKPVNYQDVKIRTPKSCQLPDNRSVKSCPKSTARRSSKSRSRTPKNERCAANPTKQFMDTYVKKDKPRRRTSRKGCSKEPKSRKPIAITAAECNY